MVSERMQNTAYIHIYIHTYIFLRTLIAQCGKPSKGKRGGFFTACSQPWRLSARFRTITRSTEVGKSTVWSDKRPPKWVANRWRRGRAVTVPGTASLQATAPARRNYESLFSSLCPIQIFRTSTVLNLKFGNVRVGVLNDRTVQDGT